MRTQPKPEQIAKNIDPLVREYIDACLVQIVKDLEKKYEGQRLQIHNTKAKTSEVIAELTARINELAEKIR